MRYLHFVIVLFIISSCRTAQQGSKSEAQSENSQKDSIVFITMKMQFDSLGNKNEIKVLKIIKKPGSLKNQLTENIESKNYLRCIVFNKKNNMKDSFCIEHPLYREIESVDEKNQFFKRNIQLKESEFFIRFSKKKYNTLLIKENSPIANGKELIIITF
jgi:hypothetical protein